MYLLVYRKNNFFFFFFFSSRRRHTRSLRDWSSDVCSSDLPKIRYGIRVNDPDPVADLRMGELASLAVPGLFPEIEPCASGMLRLDAVHSMYWEESGDPDGIPAVFLHGGPGAGSTPKHRRFFDPGAY